MMLKNHKSCYTSRHVGYKYRTAGTNTGEYHPRRSTKEDNVLERKIHEMTTNINDKIECQMALTRQARGDIRHKIQQIHGKIDQIVEFHNTVLSLRGDLRKAEVNMFNLTERVSALEGTHSHDSFVSLRPKQKPYTVVNY